MVNLNRQIGISRAKQGGFSAHVLPGPVPYALSDNLVIYWTNDGPASTKGDPAISFAENSPPTVAELVTFQGQPAYKVTSSVTFLIDFQSADFEVGNEDFTIEWWSDPGETGQQDNIAVSLRLWALDSIPAGGVFSENILGEVFGRVLAKGAPTNTPSDDLFKGPWEETGIVSLGNQEDFILLNNAITTKPGWTHLCIQKQGSDFLFHRNGKRVLFDTSGGSGSGQSVGGISFAENVLRLRLQLSGSKDSNEAAQIGQIRISKNQARYGVDDFATPSQPFYIT
jgi:hypothetical protein